MIFRIKGFDYVEKVSPFVAFYSKRNTGKVNKSYFSDSFLGTWGLGVRSAIALKVTLDRSANTQFVL